MQCRNCGTNNAEGAFFCLNCGQPLSNEQPGGFQSPENQQGFRRPDNAQGFQRPENRQGFARPDDFRRPENGDYGRPNNDRPNFNARNNNGQNFGGPNYDQRNDRPGYDEPNNGMPNYGSPNYGAPMNAPGDPSRDSGPGGNGYPEPGGRPKPAAKPVNKKLIFIIAGAAALVAIAVTLALLLGQSSPSSIAKSTARYALNGQFEKILDLFPDSFIENSADEMGMDRREFREYVIEGSDELTESIKDMDIRIIRIEVSREKKVDDDDLDFLERMYDFDSKEGYDVVVRLRLDIDGKVRTHRITIRVIKVDGKWCLSPTTNFFSLFDSLGL